MSAVPDKPVKIFLVAVEESGDQLGAALMRALRGKLGDRLQIAGVGGHRMAAEGLASLYSTGDLAIVGISAIVRKVPLIWQRLRETVQAVGAHQPDALVVIDSPEFSLRVAQRARRANPSLKVIDYVAPSVWAWRPGRARAMKRYVDHVLALLPFEPEALHRLDGPPCSYVGHPIVEQAAEFRPNAEESRRRLSDPPVIVALPGSRGMEIRRHSEIFGAALAQVCDRIGPIDLVVPTSPHLAERVSEATALWPVRPRIVTEQAQKLAAFRTARAALAKSGTVTLELALSGIPTVAAYRVSAFDAFIGRRVIQVPSVILANLVIGENVVPEFLQENCTPENLSAALVPLIGDTPERKRQIEAFARLDEILQIGGAEPAQRAADIVMAELAR